MISGHNLAVTLGVRATALRGMSATIAAQVWLSRDQVQRVCGQLTVVEANMTVDACDWTGPHEEVGPDGQADRVSISRKDRETGRSEVLATVDNPGDAARFPSRGKLGDWVIRLARQNYDRMGATAP